ncbi:MAG TPA: RNA methyltransferase [Nitriliruptorales bacterium]
MGGVDEAITSLTNRRVKEAAALQRRRTREATGRYLIEGPNPVLDALVDGVVEQLFVTPDAAAEVGPTAAAAGVSLTLVDADVLRKIADSVTPQGVVAVAVASPARLQDVVGRGFLVVLYEVADPGNAGAIVRTADAAGAAGVIFTTGSVDPYSPKAVRAAAGSVTHLPLVTGVALDDVVTACRQVGQQVVGLDAGGSTSLEEPGALSSPLALVFGNEAHGLPAPVLAGLDRTVHVPIHGRAESLNVAATVAVACYAAARAR